MYKKKREIFLLIIFILILNFVSPLSASQRIINFQGRLTDQLSNPLNGTYDIRFSIYPSDPNTAPIWTEEHNDVSVSNGVVNVILGNIMSFDEPVKVTFDEERYLGITIDCDHDPNTIEPEMTPRQRILPAIYSYNADKLDGKDGSDYTTPETDAGRPGVIENLYEGYTRLIDKYATKNELDWNKLSNIPSDFADGVDHVNDSVSNPSGTYSSMSVGYASSAGSASSAGNASAVNGVQFNPLRVCIYIGLRGTGHTEERLSLVLPSNWGTSTCRNLVCKGHWNQWEVYAYYSDGSGNVIDGGTCP
ncbi:MAG: hypothetical protein ACMUHX_11050 [bacterium]